MGGRRSGTHELDELTQAERREERRSRALEEPLDVRPKPGSAYARFEVRNPRHHTRYPVFLPAYPSREGAFCACSDFGRRDVGTCKHIEAVALWLSEHPGEGAPAPREFSGRPRWEEIDRRMARLARSKEPDALRLRLPGAALFDER